MKFHEKLDFLMNITKTTNSALSMNISLDSSHISRLRRGERRLVQNAEYIKNMAAYFARQCMEDYQKKALIEAMDKPEALFDVPEKTAEQIYIWFLDNDMSEATSVNCFLNRLADTQNGSMQNRAEDITFATKQETKSSVSLYYGIDGKREAVIRFLSSVLESKKPCELLLYSDESMDWLTENMAFQAKWAKLLYMAIAQGNRIRIIHNVSRNLDEMLEALSKWMPLYMTGAIEPFYYPKKRDGIFRRTIFVAPKKVAVSSNSIGKMADKAVNMLVRDKSAVDALVEEFNGYLSLCKPLMRIFADNDRPGYLNALYEFEKESENTIVKAGQLSLETMPGYVFKSMLERSGIHKQQELMDYFIKRKERFEENLRTKQYHEIIKLSDTELVKKGECRVCYTGVKELSCLKYNGEEYREHIMNVIALLNKCENYDVVINRETKDDDYSLYVKEDLGAIVERTAEPHVVFAINEGNMTAAFWDYLSITYNENKPGKNRVIKQLQAAYESLK